MGAPVGEIAAGVDHQVERAGPEAGRERHLEGTVDDPALDERVEVHARCVADQPGAAGVVDAEGRLADLLDQGGQLGVVGLDTLRGGLLPAAGDAAHRRVERTARTQLPAQRITQHRRQLEPRHVEGAPLPSFEFAVAIERREDPLEAVQLADDQLVEPVGGVVRDRRRHTQLDHGPQQRVVPEDVRRPGERTIVVRHGDQATATTTAP